MSQPVSPASLIGMSASLMSLGIVAVALRFYARNYQQAPIQIDDWLMIPATVLLIGSAITYIIGAVDFQFGAPTDPSLPGAEEGLSYQIVYAYKAEFIALCIQPWLLGLLKCSIVFFYRRIFCLGSRTFFSMFTAGFLVLTLVWSLAFFFAFVFSCGTDITAAWGSFEEFTSHCDNTILLDEIYAIVDFVLDLLVLVMPIPLVWRLAMSLQRRLALIFVFLIGALAVVASALRMAVMIEIAQGDGQATALLSSQDAALNTATFLYWTMLEQGLALIVACLPTLRCLCNFRAVDSIIRSARSALSLGSIRSRTSDTTRDIAGRDAAGTTATPRPATKRDASSDGTGVNTEPSQIDGEHNSYPLPAYPSRHSD